MSTIGNLLLSNLSPKTRKFRINPSEGISNKVVVVTGASNGLGKKIVLDCLENGASAVAISRNIKNLKEAYKSINSSNLLLLQCDVTEEVEVVKTVKVAIEKFGKIDVLINNVGIYIGDNIENMTSESFDKLIETNLKGMFLMTKQVVPSMKAAKKGLILNLSSRVAKKVNNPGRVLYAMTKSGVEGFSNALRSELAKTGIRVTSLMPGTFNTHMSLQIFDNLWPEELSEIVLTIIRLERVDFEEIVVKSHFSEK